MDSFDEFLATLNIENNHLTIMLLNTIRDESRFNSFGPKKIKLRPLDSIPKMQRDLMSTEDLEKSRNLDISKDILEIEEEYKLKELKELVIKNNYPIETKIFDQLA